MTAVIQFPVPSVRDKVSPAEWKTRVDLAAAYRIAHHLGWTHTIYNHISAKVPGADNQFLLNPFGLMYREITASSLVKVDLEGNVLDDSPFEVIRAGWVIHGAVHGAREDVRCVWHTHTIAGMAVGAQKAGLLPLNMGAMHFHNRIGYHDYEGPSLDPAEQPRIVAALGRHNALILRNHGLLTCGADIGATFVTHYQLEKACAAQVATLAGGGALHIPPPEVCEHSATLSARPNKGIHMIWDAYQRLADDLDPSYRQ